MTVELGDYEVYSEEHGELVLGGLKHRGDVVFYPVPPEDAAKVRSIWHVSRFLGQLCLVEEMSVEEAAEGEEDDDEDL